MDNSTLYAIESLGAKVYFFGECVWATLLKLPITHYKLAIVGGNPTLVLPVLEKYQVEIVKQTLRIIEEGICYDVYFPATFEEIPREPLPLNDAILALDGAMYRANDVMHRTISAPHQAFIEHPEELINVARIVAQTNYKIGVSTWIAARDSSPLIKNVIKRNPAYIGKQLDAILLSKYPTLGFKFLLETGLLTHILPELAACNEISQTRRGENTNVFAHTMLAIEAAENTQLLRWTMLFHDSAKPLTLEVTEDGRMHFFKHELHGARLAEEYMTRYKMPKPLIVKVKRLIEYHMFDADPKLTPKGVRRLIRRVGKEHIFDLIKVREADRKGSKIIPAMEKIELLKQKIEKELPNVT